jgi:putative serine protease PepD
MKPALSIFLGALATAATIVALFVLVGPSTPARTSVQQPQTSTVSMKATAAPSLADLYARSEDAVAYVQTQRGSGSGFLVSSNGAIVTNEHVVAGARQVTVRFGAKGKALPARVVGADAATDLAVLDVADSAVKNITPLTLGSSSGLQVGQAAIAIGSPYGLSGTLTSGIVSALGRDIESPSGNTISGVVQTDAAINPGNSGGPLLDATGKVIGVNSQIATDSGSNSGVGFAIPIDTVRRAVDRLDTGALTA